MSTRATKVVSLDDAATTLGDGAHVALGGIWNHNSPSALAREVIRQGPSGLVLSASPATGFTADLLIGAGFVRRAYLPNVTFEHLGTAPSHRRAAETRSVEFIECDEASLIGGYRAAAAGLPFQPVRSLLGTALAETSPWLVPVGRGDEPEVLAAPALVPDVVLLHAQEADEFGNVHHRGSVFADRLMAKAGEKVVVSVDRIVDHEQFRAQPQLTTIPSYLVSHVVELPFGAHPCSSHGRYQADEDHLRLYRDAVAQLRTGDGRPWEAYHDLYVAVADHEAYIEACGGTSALEERLGDAGS